MKLCNTCNRSVTKRNYKICSICEMFSHKKCMKNGKCCIKCFETSSIQQESLTDIPPQSYYSNPQGLFAITFQYSCPLIPFRYCIEGY